MNCAWWRETEGGQNRGESFVQEEVRHAVSKIRRLYEPHPPYRDRIFSVEELDFLTRI